MPIGKTKCDATFIKLTLATYSHKKPNKSQTRPRPKTGSTPNDTYKREVEHCKQTSGPRSPDEPENLMSASTHATHLFEMGKLTKETVGTLLMITITKNISTTMKLMPLPA